MTKLFFTYLLSALFLACQAQAKDASSVIDNVKIPEGLYEIDTSVNFYSDVEFRWIDSTSRKFDYNFIEGQKTYCEVSIKKTCKCHDGSSHQIIIIEIDNQDESMIVELSPSNTIRFSPRKLRQHSYQTDFSGVLDFNNHTLTFHPTYDANRNVLWGDMTFKNILLTKPKTN